MAVNGRFGDSDCLSVTGRDGKVVWIFKLEDLREVVPADVYECIKKLIPVVTAEMCAECLGEDSVGVIGDDYEKISDGYRNMLVDIMYELRSIIDGVKSCKRLNKEKLLKELSAVHDNLDKNL